MQQRAKDNPKIEFIWDSAVKEAYGNEKGLLGGVKVENLKTGEIRDLEVRAGLLRGSVVVASACQGVDISHMYSDRVLIPPPPDLSPPGQWPFLCHRPRARIQVPGRPDRAGLGRVHQDGSGAHYHQCPW